MSDPTSPTSQRPPSRGALGRAVREARAIALVAVAIAVVYNLLAATAVPWIHVPRAKTTEVDTAAPATVDTIAAKPGTAPVDTIAVKPAIVDTGTPPVVIVDTIGHSKASLDSARMAVADAKRRRDSADQAFFADLATKKEITTDIAIRLYRMKKATFIDARPEDHFAESHIVGAMSAYAEQWQSYIGDIIKIPKDRIIVTYCGGGDECELSHDLAAHIRELGYQTVLVYTGGIKDWTAKKYPTASSQQ